MPQPRTRRKRLPAGWLLVELHVALPGRIGLFGKAAGLGTVLARGDGPRPRGTFAVRTARADLIVFPLEAVIEQWWMLGSTSPAEHVIVRGDLVARVPSRGGPGTPPREPRIDPHYLPPLGT